MAWVVEREMDLKIISAMPVCEKTLLRALPLRFV
jgi:hypothetical protein